MTIFRICAHHLKSSANFSHETVRVEKFEAAQHLSLVQGCLYKKNVVCMALASVIHAVFHGLIFIKIC
ncbi:hypothetical protein HA466_0280640 [Hirschfeldia incana]|nr:hypothetical protein HA466_0280640 [Hirschfeldia incana]